RDARFAAGAVEGCGAVDLNKVLRAGRDQIKSKVSAEDIERAHLQRAGVAQRAGGAGSDAGFVRAVVRGEGDAADLGGATYGSAVKFAGGAGARVHIHHRVGIQRAGDRQG